jgi:membrane fusion protein (multidrug efflux system)
VRPQVSGIIQARLFTEGATVHAGDVLYRIDPRIYEAALNQARADLASATATRDAARTRAERLGELAKTGVVSRQDLLDAQATAESAAAAAEKARAQISTAEINLKFTQVSAPITGRIGRSVVTTGALVSAGQAEPLTTIQRLDPIFVDIQQSAADLLSLKRALAAGGVQSGSTQVRLKLDDGSDYGFTGTVQFSEMVVNESTGTVTLRARFPNPQAMLLPGMFVRAEFTQAVDPNAFLVPQQAVTRDVGGKAAVFVVGPGDKAQRRVVDATRTYGAFWVVKSGLRPGDKVITQGIGNLKDGAPVRPVPANAPQRIGPPAQAAARAGHGAAARKGG